MSHIVTIPTQVRDPAAIAAACRRLALPESVHGTSHLYSGEVTGYAVQLPGWRYPAVCDIASGQIRYDNFVGHWGDTREIDRFLQAYAVELARIDARKHGHTVTEQPLADGSIKVTIQVGGAA